VDDAVKIVVDSTKVVINSAFGGALTIDNGGQFFNNYASGNGHFHNEEATITVDGKLTNSGDMHQLLNGELKITDQGIFTTTGPNGVTHNRPGSTIENSNKIDIETGGTITNTGSSIISNISEGTIENKGTINNNGGTIDNSEGTIDNNLGTINNDLDGIIHNSQADLIDAIFGETDTMIGIIKNTGGTSITFGGSSKLINGDTSIINNSDKIQVYGGTFSNLGTINNKAHANFQLYAPPRPHSICCYRWYHELC